MAASVVFLRIKKVTPPTVTVHVTEVETIAVQMLPLQDSSPIDIRNRQSCSLREDWVKKAKPPLKTEVGKAEGGK